MFDEGKLNFNLGSENPFSLVQNEYKNTSAMLIYVWGYMMLYLGQEINYYNIATINTLLY